MEHNLRPPGDPKAALSTANVAQASGKNTRLWLLFGTAITLLLVVLLVLPAIVSEPTNTQQTPVVEVVQAAPEEAPQTETTANQLRADAEHALQDFLRLQAQPDLNNAEIWSADAWYKAMDTSHQGDEAFGQGSFAAALKAYESAGAQLQSILDNRDQTQQQSLAEGWQHLQNNAIKEATKAFERVLAMQADHQQAQLGIERASVRMQVLEQMDEGQQAEIGAKLKLAAQAYMAALQLDARYVPAQEALKRVENELSNLAFQDSMGRALQALDNGRFASAEKALNEAARISPGDQAVKDVRQRLITARRQDSLMKLRVKSEQLVSNEDWTTAAQTYRQALKIDPKASYASIGLARAQKKQQLHQQLDHYLADTTRLFSDEPLGNARQLLAANQQIIPTEPLLCAKTTRLKEAARLAVLPVDLLILSDNLTQVTIYKIGRLGNFEQKQLSLRPGKYTITGSRQGYRDVLKVIELKPGSPGQSLEIRSGESI